MVHRSTEVWERHVITLGCGLLTLVLVFGLGMHSMGAVWETLNLGSFFTSHFWYTAGQSAETSSGINWETIVFVAGMMIMVEVDKKIKKLIRKDMELNPANARK